MATTIARYVVKGAKAAPARRHDAIAEARGCGSTGAVAFMMDPNTGQASEMSIVPRRVDGAANCAGCRHTAHGSHCWRRASPTLSTLCRLL